MRAVARVAVLTLATGLPRVPLAAQAGWEPPRLPCELVPANSNVDKGIQFLRGAAEKPDQRDLQLAQAKKVLSEAIVQGNQGANPAAWYYLGRYYVAVGDVAGADTALGRAATLAPKCAEDVATYRSELVSKLLNDGLSAWQDGKQDSALALLRVAARLDSMQRGLSNDSTVLARLVASSQSRKAREAKLAPTDQQLFTRDSTARAQAVARQRAALAAAVQQLAADSSALTTAFAPAIDALKEFLAAYPGEIDAAVTLATLYAQSGHAAQAAAVFDSLAAHAKDLDPDALFGPGTRMVGQGLYRPAARALTLGLARNPYRRDALFSLGVAYYQLHDSTALLPTAQRLFALDPLNRASLKLVAAGWDFRRQRDSTKAYVGRADAGLAVEISVLSFLPDSAEGGAGGPGGASLSAVATHLQAAPSNPIHLTFEFLDVAGQVIATLTQDVPAMSPRQSHAFDLKVSGRRIAGWRYRAS